MATITNATGAAALLEIAMNKPDITAQLEALSQLTALKENIDVFFLICMSIFIAFMQCGFAFLECGSVRSKNSTNILIKNFMDMCIGGIAYWLFGYAFAFGDGNGFIGYEYFASSYLPDDKYAHWFFQYVFAATAASIVSGALAERCDTIAYFIYSFFLTGFVYPVITHWTWHPQGWLLVGDGEPNGAAHYLDFAGSGVVHLTGGIGSLIGAILLGPRIGRFDPNTGEPNDIRGHSVPFVILGGMILVVGFFAFNGGSQGTISNEGDGFAVAHAVKNTVISGVFAATVVLLLYRIGFGGPAKYWSLLMSLNGGLTGMVAICAGCNGMKPWGACVTGTVAGVVYLIIHCLLLKFKIDDPLDATSVHLGGGLWGLIAAPIFTADGGIVFAADHRSGRVLGWNILGAVVIMLWSGGLSLLMFGAFKLAGKLRVKPEVELNGIDMKKHGEPSYPAQSWIEDQYMNNATVHTVYTGNDRSKAGNLGLPPNMVYPAVPPGSHPGLHNRAFINDEKPTNDWSSTNL